MDTKYKRLKKVQKGNLILKRFRKYLVLYGIGIALWVGHLWGLAINKVQGIEESYIVRLYNFIFNDSSPKIHPTLKLFDIIGFIIFILTVIYVVYWVYADSYCRLQENGKTVSFNQQLIKALLFNLAVYAILRFVTPW